MVFVWGDHGDDPVTHLNRHLMWIRRNCRKIDCITKPARFRCLKKTKVSCGNLKKFSNSLRYKMVATIGSRKRWCKDVQACSKPQTELTSIGFANRAVALQSRNRNRSLCWTLAKNTRHLALISARSSLSGKSKTKGAVFLLCSSCSFICFDDC